MAEVLTGTWNVDTILDYLKANGASIGEDNEGQIVIYSGLYQHTNTTDLYNDPDLDYYVV